MLILSRNNIGDHVTFDDGIDVSFKEKTGAFLVTDVTIKNGKLVKNSFIDDINLIYLVNPKDYIGVAKKEYLQVKLFLKSGLVVSLYNLTKCEYEHNNDGNSIVGLDIEFSDLANFQKTIFSEIHIQNITVIKYDVDMYYDISKNSLLTLDEHRKILKTNSSSQVDF